MRANLSPRFFRLLIRVLPLLAPAALCAQLQVTTATLPAGALGYPYAQPLAASGGIPPYAWSVSAGQLPFGLTLAGGGTISGTPQLVRTFNFTVRVTDSASVSATRALSIIVGQQLMIVNPLLDTGIVGHAITTQLVAASGTPPYSFSLAGGTLPPGYSFNAAGALSGTPTQTGGWPLTFQVNDSAGGSAQRSYTLTVTGTPNIPTWRTRGLYGGTISRLAVSPAYLTDATLFAAGLDGVLFRSADAGRTWSRTPVYAPYLDQALAAVALSPQYDQNGATALNSTLFVATSDAGILKSVNHGASFAQVNTGLPCDGANPCNNSVRPFAALDTLAISPDYAADQTLWAITATNFAVHSRLYRSANGGTSWSAAAIDLGGSNFGSAGIAASPAIAADHTVFFYMDSALFRSTDNGQSWSQIFTHPGGWPHFTALAVSPQYAIDRTLLLADGPGNLFRSSDGGATFTQLAAGGFGLAAVDRPGQTPFWFTLSGGASGYQIRRSENYGDTFEQLLGDALPGLTAPNQALAAGPAPAGGDPDLFAGNKRGLFASVDGGLSAEERDKGIANVEFPWDIASDIYLAGSGGALAGSGRDGWVGSVDGGQTWVRTLTGDWVSFLALSPDYANDHVAFRNYRYGCGLDRFTGDGPTGVRVLTLPCSPFKLLLSYAFEPGFSGTTGTMYVGSQNGLYRSLDGGRTFATLALPAACGTSSPPAVYSVAVSPNFATDATIFVATDSGSCKTVNGGASWSALTYGGQPIYGPLAISPAYNEAGANGSAAKIVISLSYPAGATHKPLRSTNGGATWTLINSLGGTSAGDTRYFPRFSPNFAADGTLFVGSGDESFGLGIWRSADFGATFARITAPDQLLSRRVTGLQLLPGFSGGNTSGAFAVAVTEASGVWRSSDGGRSFAPVPEYAFVSKALKAVARAPSGTLYAATGDQGIFRSDDGGVTFANISAGLPPGADCRAVAVPSASPATPIAGCAGSGLWKYGGSAWAQLPGFTTGNYVSFLEDNQYLYANRADGTSLRGARDATGFTLQQASQTDLVNSDFNNQTGPTLAGASVIQARNSPTFNRETCLFSDGCSSPAPSAPTANSAALWAVSTAGGARYSNDSGATWTAANGGGDYPLPPGASYATVRALGVNPGSGGREVLVGTTTGLWRTTDGGASWRNVSAPGSGLEATSKNFSSFVTAPTPSGTTDILTGILGSTTGGVYLSGDGGEHWTQVNQGFDPNSLNITTLIKTSCAGCPTQYYTGTYGSGVYTRTIPVVAPPAVTGWYFGSTSGSCGTATSCATAGAACGAEQGGQPFKLCGSGFQALPVVEFDGVPATGCAMSTSAVITCTGTPARIPGNAVVRVRNTDTRQGLMASPYTFVAGTPRVVNSLRIAKSGSSANLTWSCAGCTVGAPARVYRSQNAPFTLNVEQYSGGTGGAYTNTGALAPTANPSYFWNLE